MPETGESNAIDFSFEDIEFIGENLEGNEGSETLLEEKKATAKAAEVEKGDGKTPEVIEEERIAAESAAKEGDTTEGKSPESVSSESADNSKGDEEAISPLLFQALTKDLRDQGVLSSVDESSLKDIKSVDGLIDAIKAQIKTEEFRDLSDTQKQVLDDMRKGVKPTAAGQYKAAMDNLNGLDETRIKEDKQVRFDLIYQDFLAKGFDKAKSSKLANRSFDLKEDIADAIDARESLITVVQDRYDAEKSSDIETEKNRLKKIEDNKVALKNKILSSDEILSGMKVPDTLRKEVYSSMSKIISNDPETGIPENELMKYKRENPLEYSHKLYYLFKVTNGFSNLDYFNNKKISKKTSNLENALRQSSHVNGGGDPSFNDDTNSHILDIGELVLPGEE